MAITFTDRGVFLPSGIPDAIGGAFTGPWANELGAPHAVLAPGSSSPPSVVDFVGGLKGLAFSGTSWLTWAGGAQALPMLRAVVLKNWTGGGIFDTESGAIGRILYPQGASLSTSWDGANLSAASGQSAMGTQQATVVELFNGATSQHRVSVGANDWVATGTTGGTGGSNGLTIGARSGGNQKSTSQIAAVLYSSPSLGGETDAATIMTACVQHVSEHFYPVFGDNVAGLVEVSARSGPRRCFCIATRGA